MEKRITALLIILLAASHASGQTASCNCSANLDTLIHKTELNYAGFPSKTGDKHQSSYSRLTKSVLQQAKNITDPVRCFDVLKSYIAYFRDRHFDLSYPLDSTNRKFSSLTAADFKNLPDKRNATIEGIWMNPDSTIKIGIRKSTADAYEGIVLESRDKAVPAGLVYVTLKKHTRGYTFSKYDYLTIDYPARHDEGLLRLWNMELWGRVYPQEMSRQEKAELSTWKDYHFGLSFDQLDEKTAYLRLPSFNRDDLVQALISQNDTAIRHSPCLIVDLRGNGGGNTGWAYLLPYLMTRRIDQGIAYLRISPDNTTRILKEMAPLINNPIPDGMEKYYTPAFMREYRKAYEQIRVTDKGFCPVPAISIPLDEVSPYPQKIALVFDDLCGSSTEYFFQLSRQSDKITRYGIPTLGMMDYVGMHQPTILPFKDYRLVIPDTKSSWTDTDPIDASGLKPEHDLTEVPRREWINYIKKDLIKH